MIEKELPENWKLVPLKELSGLITKGTTPTTNGFSYTNEGINFIKVESITATGSFKNEMFAHIGIDCHESFKRSQLMENDILFTIAGALGRSAIVTEDLLPANTNQAVAIIRLKNPKFKDYIFHYLNGNYIQNLIRRINVSTAQANLSLKQINSFKIALPPLPEQRKITDMLSVLDGKIQVINQQILETEELKKGLMQRLLSKGIGHTEFKDSTIGTIPKNWKVKEINEVTTYVDYRGKTPPKSDSGVSLITAKNIKSGYIDYEVSKEFIPLEFYDSVMSRGKPKVGDILITTEAPLGNIAMVDNENIALAQRVIKYRTKEDLDSGFLKYYMLSSQFQSDLNRESTGSTVKGIRGKRLHKLKVPVPSLLEQKNIKSVIQKADDKWSLLLAKQQEYFQLKKGLMQLLLTGKVRFNIPIEA